MGSSATARESGSPIRTERWKTARKSRLLEHATIYTLSLLVSFFICNVTYGTIQKIHANSKSHSVVDRLHNAMCILKFTFRCSRARELMSSKEIRREGIRLRYPFL